MQFDVCCTSVTEDIDVTISNRSIGPGSSCRTVSPSLNNFKMEYSDLVPVVQWRGGSHTTSFTNATVVGGGQALAGSSHLAIAGSGLTNGGRI